MLDVRASVLPEDVLAQHSDFDVRSFFVAQETPSAEEALLSASPLPSPTRYI